MFSKFFDRTDLPLSEMEQQVRQRNRRRWAIIAGAAVLLLIVIGLSVRPVFHAVRGWQARRHAAKALVFINQEKWNDARTEAFAAYQLRSTEPDAIRAVAMLLTRAGQTDGLKFWSELQAHTRLTRPDLREEAGLAIKAHEFETASATIKELLSKRDGGPTPADYLLAAQLELQQQDPDGALIHVRQVFASSAPSERERFRATALFEAISKAQNGKGEAEVLKRFADLARGPSDVALDALVALTQHFLNGNAPWTDPGNLSLDDLVHGLENHPLAKPQHKLLAVDVKIRQHPEERTALIEKAVDQWKGGDTAALIVLAAWLNGHQEFQREIDTISRERAMQSKELFFQHVDALGALGRWDEIRKLIESEQFPLDPVIEHMYLARCFAQQNQQAGAENNWRRALEAAAGDPGKLLPLAEYAEKNGAYEVAASAYEACLAVVPKSRLAYQGRLRVAYITRDTKKIHEILVELLKLWPNDPAVQNDEAYIRLLLLPSVSQDDSPSVAAELQSIAAFAEKLVEREPTSLPHRTVLALARLKLDQPAPALAVYSSVSVPQNALSTTAVAVHAAVLAANGNLNGAREEFSKLPLDKLLPEEQALNPDKH